MPINEQPVYDWVDVRVLNKSTGVPTTLLANGITASITRGNDAGIAGIASVEVGSALITLKDPTTPLYDPTTTSLLQPNMPIEVYKKGDDTVPIFTGVILDLSTRYEFHPIFTNRLITYVDIYAVDAVSVWGGMTFEGTSYPVNGLSTEPGLGYENWSDRITRIKNSVTNKYTVVPTIVPPSAVEDVLLYEKASG